MSYSMIMTMIITITIIYNTTTTDTNNLQDDNESLFHEVSMLTNFMQVLSYNSRYTNTYEVQIEAFRTKSYSHILLLL